MPTKLFAQETKVHRTLQGIDETSLQLLSRSTNKRKPMLTDGKTKSTVDPRFINGLSAEQEALFVPGCRPVERRIFVSVNAFYARHVRECKSTEKQNHRLTRGLSPAYQRFISEMRSALYSRLPTRGTTPFCLCKRFSCKACSKIICLSI